MILQEKREHIKKKHAQLEGLLAQPQAHTSESFPCQLKEYKHLSQLIQFIHTLEKLYQEQADLQDFLTDPELKEMAAKDLEDTKEQIEKQELEFRIALLPNDADDERNVIMEIRAGTGGEEAALFVSDLYRMYRRYAEFKGWSIEIIHMSESEQKGNKEVSFAIRGNHVFAHLKFEAGVHRVQRVPTTEASGRIHTSTATIAVLPEAEDIDIHIEEKDLRIDVFRSSGPGGQSVNTTDSAVRITHIPSGTVVQQQDEKSQHKNKAKALKVLRSRLYDKERQSREMERAHSRQSQIGRGERCERIRTYNFPQERLTDHRVKLTLYKLSLVMAGDGLEEVINILRTEHQMQQLMDLDNL
jgi:peptide chain release factor 1